MNKVVVGAVALVVAGGSVAVAGWSGAKVADELHAETSKVLQAFPGVKVVDHKVSKGLLSSIHEVTIEVGCPTSPEAGAPAGAAPEGPARITWRDRISHGPLPGARSIGLAVIDSELVLPPKVAAEVTKLLGDKPLFTARTSIGFTGNYVSEFASPAFKYAEKGKGNVDWQGLNAVVRGNLRQGIAGGGSYAMDAPGLKLTSTTEGTPMTFKVGHINMTGDMKAQPDASLWMAPSKSTGSIKSVEFSAAHPGSGPEAKPLNVVFEGLQFTGESSLEKGLLSTTSQFSAKGRVDDFVIDKVEMAGSLRRVHAATYQQIVSRFMTNAFSCSKPAEESLEQVANAEIEKGMAALLQHNPEYSLDKLVVELGGKRAELSYTLGVQGVTEADRETPLPVLFGTKGVGNASVKVQMGWIEQITKQIGAMQADTASGDAAASVQTAQAQLLAMANLMIDQFAAQGYVEREGDVVKSAIKFEGGQVTVNGKPMGMPPIGGM